MKKSKILALILSVTFLAYGFVPVAMADDTSTAALETSAAGELTVTADEAITFIGITTSQTGTGTSDGSTTITVHDKRGTKKGWDLTFNTTNFGLKTTQWNSNLQGKVKSGGTGTAMEADEIAGISFADGFYYGTSTTLNIPPATNFTDTGTRMANYIYCRVDTVLSGTVTAASCLNEDQSSFNSLTATGTTGQFYLFDAVSTVTGAGTSTITFGSTTGYDEGDSLAFAIDMYPFRQMITHLDQPTIDVGDEGWSDATTTVSILTGDNSFTGSGNISGALNDSIVEQDIGSAGGYDVVQYWTLTTHPAALTGAYRAIFVWTLVTK